LLHGLFLNVYYCNMYVTIRICGTKAGVELGEGAGGQRDLRGLEVLQLHGHPTTHRLRNRI